jgi:hypothetical protein
MAATTGVRPASIRAASFWIRDVGAGDERLLALAAEHDRADLVVRVEPVVFLLELLEQLRGEGVHGRVVEGDDRDAPVGLDLDVLSHGAPLSRSHT